MRTSPSERPLHVGRVQGTATRLAWEHARHSPPPPLHYRPLQTACVRVVLSNAAEAGCRDDRGNQEALLTAVDESRLESARQAPPRCFLHAG